MLGLLIAIIVVIWLARFVLKKYPAQPILFTAGIVMMALTIVFGLGEILPAKQTTGSPWLDIIQSISLAFSSRAAKLGMIIMLIGGFSKYMDRIGASTALVRLAIKPLQKLGRPYLVLALTSILGNFLAMFISSASGFGLCSWSRCTPCSCASVSAVSRPAPSSRRRPRPAGALPVSTTSTPPSSAAWKSCRTSCSIRCRSALPRY